MNKNDALIGLQIIVILCVLALGVVALTCLNPHLQTTFTSAPYVIEGKANTQAPMHPIVVISSSLAGLGLFALVGILILIFDE